MGRGNGIKNGTVSQAAPAAARSRLLAGGTVNANKSYAPDRGLTEKGYSYPVWSGKLC